MEPMEPMSIVVPTNIHPTGIHMSDALKESYGLMSLRQRAADKLGASSAPSTRPVPKRVSQSDAMAVLYQLASSPATVGDALALLHEMQVYQVELDLQQEEIQRSQFESETALSRQAMLVERAPVGYMTIDSKTVLFEINLAGTRLLGASAKELLGRPLALFLMPGSVQALQGLLQRAREGQASQACQTCELALMPIAGLNRIVQAAVIQDVVPERFLLALMGVCTASSLSA